MVQDACDLAHRTQNLVVQTTMLESQPNIDQVNPEGKRLGRLVCPSRKDVGGSDSSAMDDPVTDGVDGCTRDVSGMSGTSPRSWKETRERFSTETIRCCADLGSELFVQTWRERPRDASSFFGLLHHNVVAFTLVLLSGIITWESSVDDLRSRIDRTIVFPLYLPHSVALAVACIWTTAAAPGNLVGLYLVRMYMIWRGHLGFTSLNTTIMFLAAFLATLQSHIGAHFLRKFLCGVSTKRFPTIDSAKEAVWYLIIVFFLSLVFSTVISLCIAITPLLQWSSFWTYWGTWWLGVLATMITVTPLLTHLLAWEYESSLRSPGKLLECLLCVVATSAIMVIVFFVNFEHFRVLPYLCFPLITWTAFRFNRVGWAITVSIVAYCCALGTVRRMGALYNLSAQASPSSPEVIVQVEIFSCVMGIISIILAAAVKEKKVLTQKLHQLNIELEQTVDLRTLELRKANEELQISQRKAVQASHAKSDFLANMSHEIRTPIHGILGLTALLLESELTPDQTESLESVKECADLLLHIINSVLDLAKIEAGRLEVEKVPFNIRKMVSSTFRMLQGRAQQRGLKLLWEVDKCVPQTLVGDVGKLQQCLLNLVGNSLKFTHKGSVTVSVRLAADQTTMPLDIDNESANNVVGASGDKSSEDHLNQEAPDRMNVEFEVRDTGIGISQEKLLDMFKPFTQAEASTSRLYGGTGLGLCIVQRFVELLGGTIWAESELGKGSAFYIRLPFYPNKPAESSSVSSPKVFSDKIHGRQSWSLMGGLIFNPPGKYQDESNQLESGAHTWNLNLAARVRSANDLLGLFKDNKDAGLGNSDGIDSSAVNGYSQVFQGSKYRLGAVRQGSHGPEHYAWAAPELVQGGSNPVVEDQRIEKTLPDPASALNECNVPLKWDSVRSDRSASSEVTQLLQPESLLNRANSGNPESWELVQSQNFVSVSSQTSSTFSDWGVGTAFLMPHGGPMDSDTPEGEEALQRAMERERGNVIGLAGSLQVAVGAHYPHGESASVRSDLSRESSAELEKLLDSKVSLNILLAEDNAINQKVASRQLEKHGHAVTIVGDGQQALEVITSRHNEFDLVLMDVQMPTMDGLRATDLIRKAERENSWTRVPVLGLTAHAIQGYQETCLQHGMDGYLGKPFDIHQLLKTIGHLLPPDRLGQRL